MRKYTIVRSTVILENMGKSIFYFSFCICLLCVLCACCVCLFYVFLGCVWCVCVYCLCPLRVCVYLLCVFFLCLFCVFVYLHSNIQSCRISFSLSPTRSTSHSETACYQNNQFKKQGYQMSDQ